MKYQPKPMDTSTVTIPADLRELLELLARNTHEVWAAQRIADGWSYGRTRDDIQKTHPCLVCYDELAENEKQYDRNTAEEIIKAILLVGYEITKTQ